MSLLYLAVVLWEWCYKHVFPIAIHISTEENDLADWLSRVPKQTHEWELDTSTFHDLSQVGNSSDRYLRHVAQQDMRQILLPRRMRPSITRKRFYDELGSSSTVSLPTFSSGTKDSCQNHPGQSQCHTDSTMVAQVTLVYNPQSHECGLSNTTINPTSSISGCRASPPPGSNIPASDSVENSPLIYEVLSQARKPSTTLLYSYKWQNFLRFADTRGLQA